jgi:heme-degrading monooxygenase HmoA
LRYPSGVKRAVGNAGLGETNAGIAVGNAGLGETNAGIAVGNAGIGQTNAGIAVGNAGIWTAIAERSGSLYRARSTCAWVRLLKTHTTATVCLVYSPCTSILFTGETKMFISQVTFESAKTNEGRLKGIMKKKAAVATNVAGLLSSECWVNETPEKIGYTLVIKWESQEHFKAWMRDTHSAGHGGRDEHDSSAITKTACQYEVVDLHSL